MKENVIAEIPLKDGQTLELSVSYSKGGMNYFSGNAERRGYYLHAAPMRIKKEDGYTTRSFTMMSGMKAFLLEVKRQSPKAAKQALELSKGVARRVALAVLEKGKLEAVNEADLPQDAPDLRTISNPQLPRQTGPAPRANPQLFMTKENLDSLPALGATSEQTDPMVQVKFFDPTGSWTWYAIEYDPSEGIFFGMVKGVETELGSFSRKELEDYRGAMSMGIERDIHFRPTRLSKIQKKLAVA